MLPFRRAAPSACDEVIILPDRSTDEMLAPAPDGTPGQRGFLPGSLGECFIPQIVYSTILAYNTDLFPEDEQPDAIEALFDVENYPAAARCRIVRARTSNGHSMRWRCAGGYL